MSLQVWLPLNGNLNNNGLLNISPSLSGSPTFTDGKIGPALTTSTDGQGVVLNGIMSTLSTFTNYSMACWVYITKEPTGHSSTILSSGDWNQPANQMCFALYNYSSGYKTLLVPNRSGWSNGINLSHTLALNTWYHIAIIYNGTKTDAYINGEYSGSYSGGGITPTSNTPNAKLFAATYTNSFTLNGKINDFRIYNHCLSIKEIKELAKAKVLHYKLSSNKPVTNLKKNTSFVIYNNYSTNITTSLTQLSNETYQGAPIYRLTMTPITDSGLSAVKSGLAGTGVYQNNNPTFKASTKYCYWVYWRPVTHSDVVVGGTASNIAGWTEIASHCYRDGWYRVGQYRNGSVTTDKSDGIFTSFYCPSIILNKAVSIDFCCPHLIQGYSSIVEEDGYLYDSNTQLEYDVSGNGYNGLIYNISEKSNDSARYNGSYVFSGPQYIVCPRDAKIKDAITVSIWGYMNNWSQYSSVNSGMRLASCTESGGWNFEPTSNGIQFSIGTGTSSNTYKSVKDSTALSSLSSGWHMFTGTYDGKNIKIYVDGQLKETNTAYSTKTPIFYNSTNTIFVGAEANTSAVTPESSYRFVGKLSDFRIYGTALSDEDILELYQSGGVIDNNGNVYTGEFIEVDN